MHTTRATESALNDDLRLVRGAGASKWGYFLRAETMHGLFSYLEDLDVVAHYRRYLDGPGRYLRHLLD